MGGHPGLCWLSPAPAPGSWGAGSQGWHTRWHGFDQSWDGAVRSEYEAFQNDCVLPRAYHVWPVVFAEANQRARERKEGMKEGGKEEGRREGREEGMKAFIHGAQGVGDRDAVSGQCSLRGACRAVQGEPRQGSRCAPLLPTAPGHRCRRHEWEMIHPSMAAPGSLRAKGSQVTVEGVEPGGRMSAES